MTHIPFLFINVTALSCFVLMFVTFLATKKTAEIWSFLAVLLDAILWVGGSIPVSYTHLPISRSRP